MDLTQCVIDKSNKFFAKELEKVQLESVIKIDGTVVVERSTRYTINQRNTYW